MSSTRFPGKVIKPIAAIPAIVYMVFRVRSAKLVDNVVVVTSVDPSDDPLVELLSSYNIATYRGDLRDVLKRYFDAAKSLDATQVVRLTGDCPLIDPKVIDAVIQARERGQTDYSSNVDPPSFPDGMDCECFSFEALELANNKALLDGEREHVTLWMRSDRSGLSRSNYALPLDASHLRLTIDYPDDLEAVRRLVAVMPDSKVFDCFDMLRGLTQYPDILNVNKHMRNEGLKASSE
ncbi:Glutamate-1-semialdehyde 2,1-aminomutase OS=Eoetvoesiella caeni OX=645616 GN=DFR37_10299 PE=4 SV=1 [Eoetvoesiella caeni]